MLALVSCKPTAIAPPCADCAAGASDVALQDADLASAGAMDVTTAPDFADASQPCEQPCSSNAVCTPAGNCNCNPGFAGDGLVCKSHLVSLKTIPSGPVALSADATSFAVSFGISATSVAIEASASGGAPVFFGGQPVPAGLPSAATPIVYGVTELTITVGEGVEAVGYGLQVTRKLKGQEAYIKADKVLAGQALSVVALQGNRLAVGAPGDTTIADAPGSGGAAFVFERQESGSWQQTGHFDAPSGTGLCFFGYSLALSANTLAIGEPGAYSDAIGGPHSYLQQIATVFSGKVHLYDYTGKQWQWQATLIDPHVGDNDGFGSAVALHGDTLLVGSSWEGSKLVGSDLPYSGGAYVFVRQSGKWEFQQRLSSLHADAYDRFGYSVALQGNLAVVGAVGESSAATGVNGDEQDNGKPGSGAAYVFQRSGATWSQVAYLKTPKPTATGVSVTFMPPKYSPNIHFPRGTMFGSSVAVSGARVAVGAGDGFYDPAKFPSTVVTFVAAGGGWVVEAVVTGLNTEPEDVFGQSVALQGDVLLVAAPHELTLPSGKVPTDAASFAGDGAAYLFVRDTTAWQQVAYQKGPTAVNCCAYSPRLGWRNVAISGDTLAVAAGYDSSCSPGIGADPYYTKYDKLKPWGAPCAGSGAIYVFR